MKKNYQSPCIAGVQFVMHQFIMAGGSIEEMRYGGSNLFGDDDDDAKAREDEAFGNDDGDIQRSLW